MKKFALSLIVSSFTLAHANAAVSITQLGTAYTENFATFDGSETPTNFDTFGSGFPNYGGLYDREGSYQSNNLSYALRDNANSTERAFGMKRPSSTAIATLNWLLTNDTGSDITKIDISWTAWQVSQGGRATQLTLFNYNGGSGFGSDGLTSTTFMASTGSPDANLSAITVSAQSATIVFPNAVPDGGSITLGWRWLQGAGSGGNAHVGLTNLSITAIPEPSTALFGLVAALGFAVRRRRA